MSDHPFRGQPAPSARRSSAEIERELQHTRESLEGTLAQIERDLDPAHLARGAWSALARGTEGLASGISRGADATWRQMRAHPVAFALLGTGALAVALGVARERRQRRDPRAATGTEPIPLPIPEGPSAMETASGRSGPASQARSQTPATSGTRPTPTPNGEGGPAGTSRLRGPFSRLHARAEILREHAALRARAFAQDLAENAAKTRARVRIRLEEQPLGWALLGLCAGVLAAALLPQRETERRILRPARAGLLTGSASLFGAGLSDEAADAAPAAEEPERAPAAASDEPSEGVA